jgi:hypothetical protein
MNLVILSETEHKFMLGAVQGGGGFIFAAALEFPAVKAALEEFGVLPEEKICSISDAWQLATHREVLPELARAVRDALVLSQAVDGSTSSRMAFRKEMARAARCWALLFHRDAGGYVISDRLRRAHTGWMTANGPDGRDIRTPMSQLGYRLDDYISFEGLFLGPDRAGVYPTFEECLPA